MSGGAHCQFVDAESGDRGPVPAELRDERQLVEVPDDAGPVPGATDHHVVRRGGHQTRHRICVAQQCLADKGRPPLDTRTGQYLVY